MYLQDRYVSYYELILCIGAMWIALISFICYDHQMCTNITKGVVTNWYSILNSMTIFNDFIQFYRTSRLNCDIALCRPNNTPRYKDNLIGSKPSLKRCQLIRNYARILFQYSKKRMFCIFVRISEAILTNIQNTWSMSNKTYHFAHFEFFTIVNTFIIWQHLWNQMLS